MRRELMYLACRLVRTARSMKLVFGRGCRAVRVFEVVYWKRLHHPYANSRTQGTGR